MFPDILRNIFCAFIKRHLRYRSRLFQCIKTNWREHDISCCFSHRGSALSSALSAAAYSSAVFSSV